MPDGGTHQFVGVLAGGGYAAYRARGQQPADLWPEALGGIVGGLLGGSLPDSIEPATSSWHRDVAHSWAVGGGILALGGMLATFESTCRERAAERQAIAVTVRNNVLVPALVDSPAPLAFSFSGFLCQFLAGFVNGLVAGYLSHLALDATTPRSIPFLTNDAN